MTQLQVVLQVTKKLISLRQIVMVFAADVSLVVQFMQCKQRSSRPKPTLLAAIDTLQTLHEKFDVPDSSAVELHVYGPSDRAPRRHPPTASLVDSFARLKCGLHGREVYIRVVNIRRDGGDEFLRESGIACRVARFDHRL